jgi:protein SPA2
MFILPPFSSLPSYIPLAATSALFLQKPKFDDHLPVSADGAIPDVHLTAFLTAIDSLLSAGRGNAPTRVLTPMKSVVNAVTNILDDVRSHSRRYSDPEGVHALEERVEATLSNLVAASKTHATSLGLSPVSLLDAAASHVSAAVTELGRVVLLRRATKVEQEQFAPSTAGTATNGFTPGLRTVDEVRPSATHQRGLSESSRRSEREREPLTHESSSDDSSSAAPTIFDQRTANAAGLTSPDSAAAEGSEDAWTELRVSFLIDCPILSFSRLLTGVRVTLSSHTWKHKPSRSFTRFKECSLACEVQHHRQR